MKEVSTMFQRASSSSCKLASCEDAAMRRNSGESRTIRSPITPRSREQVARFFDGLDMIGPGAGEPETVARM
jgi:S-adenosyl methyltransferase